MKITRPLLLMLASLVTACGTYSVRSDREIQKVPASIQTIDLPPVGPIHSVEIGESLVRKERASVAPAIRLENRFDTESEWMGTKFKIAVLPGLYVRSGRDARGTYYAAQGDGFQINGKASGPGGIYVSNLDSNATEVYTFNPIGKLIIYPLPGIIHANASESSAVTGGFRRELVYSGVSKGTVAILYREYANDLARPAFSQELRYDLSDGRVIGYKGARFEIIEASNLAIKYRVIKPLE